MALVTAMARSLALILLGALLALTALQRAEPAQSLPLVKADFPLCAPVAPDGDGSLTTLQPNATDEIV